MSQKPISETSEWTFALIGKISPGNSADSRRFGLDTYPVQLEIITAEQMMDAYASVGMPIGYTHWSFGKEFVNNENAIKEDIWAWPMRLLSTQILV